MACISQTTVAASSVRLCIQSPGQSGASNVSSFRSSMWSVPTRISSPKLHMHSTSRSSTSRFQVSAEIEFLTLKEAKEAVEQGGYKLVDVRDPSQFDRAHIKGSTHIPFFVPNNDNDPGTIVKRAAHSGFAGALYGLAFTKPNPEFSSTFQKIIPEKDAKLLLVCQEGLRSVPAAELLEGYGYSNLAVLTQGLNKVAPGTFEKEGTRELQEAGKGGFVSIQTQFTQILGSILIALILFLQFFPDAATNLLR